MYERRCKKETKSNNASFGHDVLCAQLVDRIDTQFKAPKRNIEPSLVIGLFGEWGSGKSHLLNLIEKHYHEEKNSITIPIAFNPWRFEKEDHLIIPLMKTTELALKAYAEKNKSWLTGAIEGTSRLCAVSVIAFIANLKVGVSTTQLIDGDKIVKTYQHYAELIRLQYELTNKTWQAGEYRSFTIRDPKLRLVSAAPFRDRVVHHALCNIIEPIYFIRDSFANRKGKCTHAALDKAQRYMRRFPYVLQCDLKQFFPSCVLTKIQPFIYSNYLLIYNGQA